MLHDVVKRRPLMLCNTSALPSSLTPHKDAAWDALPRAPPHNIFSFSLEHNPHRHRQVLPLLLVTVALVRSLPRLAAVSKRGRGIGTECSPCDVLHCSSIHPTFAQQTVAKPQFLHLPHDCVSTYSGARILPIPFSSLVTGIACNFITLIICAWHVPARDEPPRHPPHLAAGFTVAWDA
ncbi:hypothetical protein IWZ03DRAFT_82023 [Phyllosticta citriasiana]|uniref:Uncharacterized protein n=1 Tax=Phyllosticta citriasiana TaxID=595635 RepID=A0ABR1K9S6_9PEZI